jgi:hypothetical protein
LTSNRLKSTRFRELVSLYLQLEGLPVHAKPDNHGQISHALRDGEKGHVQGLADWEIVVRNEGTRDLSGGLNQAVEIASSTSKPWAAVVFHRPNRSAGEHFVVVTLETFARALAAQGAEK